MKLPQIRLESKFIQHGIKIEKPVQEIEQPKAILEIKQPQADLTINRTPGKLTINQTEAWAAMNRKTSSRFISDAADDGYQAALEGIARRASEGDAMARIQNKRNAFAQIAKDTTNPPPASIGIAWIPPLFSVKINYEPAQIDIKSNENPPEIHVTPQAPIHTYTEGKVEGEIEQWNELKVDFTNLYA